MKKVFKIVLGIIGALVIVGIIGNIAGGNNSSSSSTTTTTQPSSTSTQTTQKSSTQSSDPDSELKTMLSAAPAPTVVKSDVDVELTYTLTNNTNTTFDYVELDVDFYNKSGVKIDNAMTNTTHVTPGQKFQLKVTTMDTTATSYKVTGIYSSALHN